MMAAHPRGHHFLTVSLPFIWFSVMTNTAEEMNTTGVTEIERPQNYKLFVILTQGKIRIFKCPLFLALTPP
ncbi:MAG: hypothetical protein LUD76_00360, partial [Alistipes sp.]|nr:hypothetical protein [Alistipes sp.]